MDDPSHQSPPSSRKSSVLGKLDRPETPTRGSPYLTRSRKSSTLTEENIAVHNDTPTTRGGASKRITRRMSQSNENAVVSTPLPLARRTRRSPSVASGDESTATPKKKFSVPQENVVIEEDETMEEKKVQSTGAGTNGSKVENEVDKENTMVNGNASGETSHQKSQDSNKTDSVVEQPTEPEAVTEAATVHSNELAVSTPNSGAIQVEVSTKNIESTSTDVSTTQSSDPSSTSTLNQNVTGNSQTAVAIDEQPEPDSTELSESSFDNVRKSTSETNTPTKENSETASAASKLNSTSKLELNDTVFEIKTPNKSSLTAGPDVIVIEDTPNASITADFILIPDTPLQTQKPLITETKLQKELFPTSDGPENVISKIVPPTVQSAQQPKTPSNMKPVQQEILPKTPVQLKTSATPDVGDPVIPKVVPSTIKSVPQTDSPKTPVHAKASGASDDSTPVTPRAIPKTVPVTEQSTQQVNSIESPSTPVQTKKTPDVATSVATPETTKTVVDGGTPNSNLNFMIVTESEEEMLLRTPPPPSKTASEQKSKADATPNAAVDPPQAVPLQNGTLDENDKSKWGSSIRRKSDGKPIDKFGVDKSSTEAAKPTTKSTEKITSTVRVLDASDEEESIDDDDSNSETRSHNDFLDDEAMESNGEASMDEEERKYLEENEIPEDGISLGSESDEEMTEEEESDDSFIVSDASIQLLDGSGDDLAMGNEPDTSAFKRKRGNKILDTSDEEPKEEPKNSTKKRRPESSLNRTAKYLRVDEEDEEEEVQHTIVNESGDEDELANVNVEPKKSRRSKRLSETTSLSKKDPKRLSLHPNMKFNARDSNVKKNDPSKVDDDSEEDVTHDIANLDGDPSETSRSKKLSDSLLSSVESHQDKKQTPDENGLTAVDDSSKATVEEELANLDSEPKKAKNKNRLSESNLLSKKATKRLSLHPNTKLSSSELNEDEQAQNREQQSKTDEVDMTEVVTVNLDEELANLDDEPKIIGKSKRLSHSMSSSKLDAKRLSLHPSTKLNHSGFDFKAFASTINATGAVDFEETAPTVPKPDVNGQSALSTGQQKVEAERSVQEIQARCDEVLRSANEVRRLEKLNKLPLQEDKYQRLKEKRAAKLQEKKDKEARALEREALAAKQRQLKREKKSKITEVSEQERTQAIEKAMKFSAILEAIKNKHSAAVTARPTNESTDQEATTPPVKSGKRKRKPKTLQILNVEPNQTKKKRRIEDTDQMSAKPEGFKTSSLPIKPKNIRVNKPKRIIQQTSAGNFEIEPLPKNSASPFVVTTLQYNPAIKFASFKDKAISNSNVQRVSAIDLLNRKKKQKKMQKN